MYELFLLPKKKRHNQLGKYVVNIPVSAASQKLNAVCQKPDVS